MTEFVLCVGVPMILQLKYRWLFFLRFLHTSHIIIFQRGSKAMTFFIYFLIEMRCDLENESHFSYLRFTCGSAEYDHLEVYGLRKVIGWRFELFVL